MSECQNCGGRAELFLCRNCMAKLKCALDDAPWWLSRLAEAAVGDTRMSDGTGRGYDTRYPIHGEDPVAHYLGTYPGDSDDVPDEKARARRYDKARREILAAGGVNERACALLEEAGNLLSTTVRDLCEARGAAVPDFAGSKPVTQVRTPERAEDARA